MRTKSRNLSKEEVAKLEKERKYVVRLKVPLTGETIFEDGIKGEIKTPNADIDDQILMKSDGYPTYHFANVVDDYLMKITHVISARVSPVPSAACNSLCLLRLANVPKSRHR